MSCFTTYSKNEVAKQCFLISHLILLIRVKFICRLAKNIVNNKRGNCSVCIFHPGVMCQSLRDNTRYDLQKKTVN